MPTGTITHDFLLFYAGVSFLAIFYWFVSFLYTKTRNYLVLIFVTISHLLFNLNTSGVVLHYEKAELIFLAFVVFSFCVLASELVEFKKNLSSFSYSLFVIISTFIVGFQMLSPLILNWQISFTISFLLFIASVLYVPALFLYLWIVKKQAAARFAFCAFFPTGVATIGVSLVQIGVLPTELRIMAPIAVTIFNLFLIYGMVSYVIVLRYEREREHFEKEEIIQQQNIFLKTKIEQRTRELETEKQRSEELLISASQKQMAELELQSLRAQLNPHFMFNSLNAIQELILKEDFENSHTYLARFAKLLRMLLENSEQPFTPLQKEIDFLELYLSLEQLRLPDLQFSITTDPRLNKEETLIPNMILQPYIENALWHGLSHKPADRKLEISIQKQDETVIYHIIDNGVGRKKAAELKSLFRKEHRSKGMELLTKRFKLLSEEFGFEIKTEVSDVMINGEVGGTKVSISVPDSLAQNNQNELYDTYNYH